MFITVKNGRIDGIYSGDKKKFKGAIDVPGWFSGVPGDDIRIFTKDFHTKPLKLLLEEGVIALGPTQKVEEEAIVEKTEAELVRDGLKNRPAGMKVVDKSGAPGGVELEEMTLEERLEAGEITQEEADFAIGLMVRGERAGCFRVYDEAAARLSREIRLARKEGKPFAHKERELARWDSYAQELADMPFQPGFPRDVVWPNRPDGVLV